MRSLSQICLGSLFLLLVQPAVLAESPAERVTALVGTLDALDATGRVRAVQEIESICLKASSPSAKERRAVSQALIQALEDETLSAAAKRTVVRRLGQVGQWDAVRPLAKVLEESPELREEARRALEANPTPMSLRALRNALEKAEGDFKAALIQSVGARRDVLSVGPLLAVARGDDPEHKMVALRALAKIGERSGLYALSEAMQATKSETERDTLREIFVTFAWSLKANEEGGAARRIFIQLIETGGRWQVPGLVGLGKTGIPSDVPVIIESLDHADANVRRAALEALVTIRGGSNGAIKKLKTAPADLQVGLIEVLQKRAEPKSLETLTQSADSEHEAVRVASMKAIAAVGNPAAVDTLIKKLADPAESVRNAATVALADPDLKADEALEKALESESDAGVKERLSKIVKRRRS